MQYVKSIGGSVAISTIVLVILVLIGALFTNRIKLETVWFKIETEKDSNIAEDAGLGQGPVAPLTDVIGVVVRGSGGWFAPDMKLTVNVISKEFSIPAKQNGQGDIREVIACPKGEIAISAAWKNNVHIQVLSSYMTLDKNKEETGWFFRVFNDDPSGAHPATLIVNCASFV